LLALIERNLAAALFAAAGAGKAGGIKKERRFPAPAHDEIKPLKLF
jgi:hypothetical protein